MTNPTTSWRTKPPKIALTEQLSFHQGETLPFDIGRIQGFYDDRQPFVQIDLLIPAGTWFESQYGVAQMMTSLLKSGTSNHSGEALNALIEETGGNIAIQRGTYYIHVIVQGLNHSIEILLDLLFDMLSESIFDETELSKRVTILSNKLRRLHQQPEYRASKEISKLLYGESHPYGRSLDIQHLEKIKMQDVQNHANQWLCWNTDCIGTIAGCYNPSLINHLSEGLTRLTKNRPSSIPEHEAIAYHAKKIVTQRQDSKQHAIRLAHPTISAHHEDAYGLRFLNNVLGGFFGSRLMSNIREDKGYTYGIQSSLHQLKYGNSLIIGTEVAHQYTEATLHEIFHEIQRLQNELIEGAEWRMMQNYYNGLILRTVNSAFSVAKTYRRLTSLGIPLDSIHKDLEVSLSLNPTKVRELARKHIDPDLLSQVIIA